MDIAKTDLAAQNPTVQQIDDLCDLFEQSWKAEEPLAIEPLLERINTAGRAALFEELLAIEVAYRRRNLLPVVASEFASRFAEFADVVRRMLDDPAGATDVFPAEEPGEGDVAATARFVRLEFFKAGGLGALYRAHDSELDRDVALKFILPKHRRRNFFVERFRLEATVTGRLDHPGVVPVYGFGECADGRPFYAMRFVEGSELKEEIEAFHRADAPRLELHRLIGHLIAVCQTVAYAHSRGVIHRDIKPDNIKIGRFGETILLDWGMAQSIDRDDTAKGHGWASVVHDDLKARANSDGGAGTIGYMSPEQTLSPPAKPAAATDVYSLGATLYHLLTGVPSVVGGQESFTRLQIQQGKFPSPREQNGRVPRALDAICLKAMATNPADRYARAMDLADDLRAWLADEAVAVYREPIVERALRYLRRHRALALGICAAAVLLTAGLVGLAGFENRRADQERRDRLEAETARAEADAARAEAERAQRSGMVVAARMAAKAVAADVELRWRSLESRAADPELIRRMAEVEGQPIGSPPQEAIQAWVEAVHRDEPITAQAWVVTDATGRQVARSLHPEETVGQNFGRRDYFHGRGQDLPPGETPAPITAVHRSNAFVSKSSSKVSVAFSAPIWDPARRDMPIGVLSHSVTTRDYGELLEGVQAGQAAVLVDLSDDVIDAIAQGGLVLHHPDYDQLLSRRVETGDLRETARVAAVDLAAFRELLGTALWSLERLPEHPIPGKFVDAYQDPVMPATAAPVRAAVQPVLIKSRQGEASNPQWVVIVHDRAAAATAP